MSSHMSTSAPQNESALSEEVRKLQFDLRQESKRADRAQEDLRELKVYHEQRGTGPDPSSQQRIAELECQRDQIIAEKDEALTSLATLKQENQALSARNSEVVGEHTRLQAQVRDFRISILATELGRTLREPGSANPIVDDQAHEPHQSQEEGTGNLPQREITQSSAELKSNEGQKPNPFTLGIPRKTPEQMAQAAERKKLLEVTMRQMAKNGMFGVSRRMFEESDLEDSDSVEPEQVSEEPSNPAEASMATETEGSRKETDSKKRPRTSSSRSRSPRRRSRAN